VHAKEKAAVQAKKRVVKIASDPYPPWVLGEIGTIAKGGIATKIVGELFHRLNMKSRVNIYPFKRGLQRTKDGDEDVILMVSRSKERDKYMLFTQPIREVKFVFYHSVGKKNFNWNKWEDLKPYVIGVVTGYNLGEKWQKVIKKHKLTIEEVKTDTFNVEKLLQGRIDILLSDFEVMEDIIRRNPKYQGKLKHHKKPVFESINNFGISKKSFLVPMLFKINKVIQEMKDDGTFNKIFCQHGKIFQAACEYIK